MIDCLILGDSIAVGTHQAKPECVAYAQVGINSLQWNKKFGDKPLKAGIVIISLGSNDSTNIRTIWELQQLRDRVKADQVFWIMPAIKPDVQAMVEIVAKSYNDTILTITSLQPDKVHPTQTGYKGIVNNLKGI